MNENSLLTVGLIGPLPPPFGGMANQANQLYRLLESEGINVIFVQTNADYPNQLIACLKGVRALFRLVPYFIKVWKLAGEAQLIHVLSNSGWSWQLFSAPVLWLGWLRNTPVIINYRGGEAQRYFEKSIDRVRPSIKKAAAVVVPSGYLQNIFSDFSIRTKVIPNIIDLNRFAPSDKNIDSTILHLVVTRNLEAIYGIETAIRAVAILKEKIPNVRLSIAGSGEQLTVLQNLVGSLNLQEEVVFTGKLNPDQIVRLYHTADIMLNPTTVDNMPNSILEALACGLPVVTTNVGGIPYIVKDNETALFTQVNDPNQMASQVLRIVESPDLYNKLRNQGLNEVEQYAWNEVKKLWIDLYCKVKK
jgi:glycosyltransferase involved in cell wall biosynthesis